MKPFTVAAMAAQALQEVVHILSIDKRCSEHLIIWRESLLKAVHVGLRILSWACYFPLGHIEKGMDIEGMRDNSEKRARNYVH